QKKANNIRREENLKAAEAGLADSHDDGLPPITDTGVLGAGNDGDSNGHIFVRYDRSVRAKQPQYIRIPSGDRGASAFATACSRPLRGGSSALTPDAFAALRSADATQAGYLVAAEQFASELLKSVDDLVFVRGLARLHTVREAESLGIRKRTSAASAFGW